MQKTEGTSRTWLGPLTGLSFMAVGGTGVLMFCHVRLPGMTMLHELGGLLFVVVGVWHLMLNWRPFCRYCGQRKGITALVVGALLMTLFVGLGLGHDKEHGRHGPPGRQAIEGARHP